MTQTQDFPTALQPSCSAKVLSPSQRLPLRPYGSMIRNIDCNQKCPTSSHLPIFPPPKKKSNDTHRFQEKNHPLQLLLLPHLVALLNTTMYGSKLRFYRLLAMGAVVSWWINFPEAPKKCVNVSAKIDWHPVWVISQTSDYSTIRTPTLHQFIRWVSHLSTQRHSTAPFL